MSELNKMRLSVLLFVCNTSLITLMALVFLIGCAGPKGDMGAPGSDGAVGATGPQGTAGTNGADGQPARVVQLCPGTTSYPGVFVEVGLCINNELFGVYSANGGFLTKLPPGNYKSKAIGSACNLTIRANCIVSN